MNNIIIRRGKKEDVEKLWPIEVETRLYHKELDKNFLELGKYDVDERCRKKWLKSYYRWLNKKNSILLVAELNREIIGYINGRIFKWKWSNTKPFDVGKVGDLAVLKKYRRNGIGKKLMEEFENVLKSRKIKFVELNVTSGNEIAYSLYKKRGYKNYTLTMLKKIK